MKDSHLVFVFGTLKEHFPNFHINRGRRTPGEFQTVEAYPLYLVGDRCSPWMLAAPGEGVKVRGQVFAVTDDVLAKMDLLERVDEPDGYRRVELVVEKLGSVDGSRVTAFAYVKPREAISSVAIRSGPLQEYSLDHAAIYRPRNA